MLGACLFGGERFNAVVAYDGGFVTGHADGMLKMWDLAADAVGSMHAHQGPIVDVAVTQDGSFIASASPVDSTIFVRHGAASFRLEGHEAGVISIALVGEHEPRLLSGSRDGTARLWNLDDGSCERVFDHDSAIYSVALHADRGIAVVGDYAGRVTVHDIEGDLSLIHI